MSRDLDDADREAMRAEFRRPVPPTAAEFCRRWGVSASTFRRYRAIFAGRKVRLSTEPAPLLPVLGTIRLTSRPVPSSSTPPSCFEEVPDGRP